MGFFFGKKDQSPETLEEQAVAARDQGEFQKALRLFEKSLKARSASGTEFDEAAQRTKNRIVGVLVELQRNDEAETLSKSVIEEWEQSRRPHTVESMGWLHTLGLVYSLEGKFESAAATFKQCLSHLSEMRLEKESISAVIHRSLGDVLASQGLYAEAEHELRSAAVLEEQQGRRDEAGAAYKLLADFYAARGRFAEAGDAYQRAVVMSRGVVSKKEIASLLLTQARQRELENRFAEAEKACRDALGELSAASDDIRDETVESLERLARLQLKQKRYADAEQLQQRIVEWRSKQLGENHRLTLLARKVEADILLSKNMTVEASLIYEDILSKAKDVDGWMPGDDAVVLIALAISYSKLQFTEKARALCEKAVASSNADLTPDEETRIEIQATYASILAMMHEYAAAEKLAHDIAELYAHRYGDAHYWTVSAKKALAMWMRRARPEEEGTQPATPVSDPDPPKYESHVTFLLRELSPDATQRSIRVFISSTFRDMMDEREYLMKKAFPQLRRRCAERGIDFLEVDLRWGVTEEEAKQGKVIEICLREIDKSRPYFIGILGERYGWSPSADEYQRYTRVLESFPWVKEDIEEGFSITEMEIQYGVLRNPAMLGSAFFYLRNPDLTPAGEGFRELPESVPTKKLSRLKETLTAQQSFPVKSYRSYDELATQVAEDLWRVIAEHFPSAQLPEQVERQRLDHMAFLKRHLGVHVGFDGHMRTIDAFVESERPFLIVTGPAGSGKSALLANWIAQFQQKHTDHVVLFHFTGNAPGSTSLNAFLQRLIREIANEFRFVELSPDAADYLREAFRGCIEAVPADRRLVIVVDACDALVGEAPLGVETHWIPEKLPPHVHIILSAGEKGAAEIAHPRSCEVITLQALGVEVRRQLIEKYLLGYGKSLKNENVAKIERDEVSDSPLTLRALLDELRVFGVHEKLDAHIDHYLEARGPVELFVKVLERLENDYGGMCDRLLARTLPAITLSSNGVTEKELLDISGVAPLYWSFVDNALTNQLLRGNGLIRFGNTYFAEAVRLRYLNTKEEESRVTSQLIAFFMKAPVSPRSLEELPPLLRKSGDPTLFEKFVSTPGVVNTILNGSSVVEFQILIREQSGRVDIAQVFARALETSEQTTGVPPLTLASTSGLIALLLRYGADAPARAYAPFYEKAAAIRRSILGEGHVLTAAAMVDLANAYLEMNDVGSAVPVLGTAFKTLHAQAPNSKPFRDLLFVMAKVYLERGEYEDADTTLARGLEVNERVLGHSRSGARFRSDALRKRALVASKTERYNDAVRYMEQAIDSMIEAAGSESQSLPLLKVLLANYHAFSGNESAAEEMYRPLFAHELPVMLPLAYYGAAAINYGNLLANQKRFAEAEAILMTGLAALKGRDVLAARSTEEGLLTCLSDLYEQQGMKAKAEEYRRLAAACSSESTHG